MRVVRSVVVGLVVLSCGGPGMIAPDVDAGDFIDSGIREVPDAGTESVDAGPDAGTPGEGQNCSVTMQSCPNGLSCLYKDVALAAACFAGACDVVQQNCAAGQKCTYVVAADRSRARACVPAGALTEGASCDSTQDACDRGLICVQGQCVRYCYSTSQCGQGSVCARVLAQNGTPEFAVTCRAIPQCDPLAQNCMSGKACYPSSTGSFCLSPGSLPEGQSCSTSTANCQAGFSCSLPSPGAQGSCAKICNLDGGVPSCASGHCTPQGVGYGVCTP